MRSYNQDLAEDLENGRTRRAFARWERTKDDRDLARAIWLEDMHRARWHAMRNEVYFTLADRPKKSLRDSYNPQATQSGRLSERARELHEIWARAKRRSTRLVKTVDKAWGSRAHRLYLCLSDSIRNDMAFANTEYWEQLHRDGTYHLGLRLRNAENFQLVLA